MHPAILPQWRPPWSTGMERGPLFQGGDSFPQAPHLCTRPFRWVPASRPVRASPSDSRLPRRPLAQSGGEDGLCSIAVPVVLCPAIRAEALPFGERQVTDAIATLRAGAGGGLSAGGNLNRWSPAPAPGPWEEKRRAVSGRQPEPLVRPSRSWTPGGSSAGANRRLRWGGPVCGSWPSPCGSGARCTPSGVHGWVLWRACGEGPGVAVPVVLCPAIRAEALPFGEWQVDGAVTTLRAGAGGGDRTVTATVESAHTPSRCGRRAASGRQPEALVTSASAGALGREEAGCQREAP